MFGGTPDGNATIAQAAVSMAYKHHGEGYLAPGKPLYQSVFNLVMPGSYPLRSCDRFVCASVRRSGADDNYPDYRQTLYWHPLLEVGAGESVTIPCSLPDYRGSFVVVAEGLDAAGRPVHCRISFTN